MKVTNSKQRLVSISSPGNEFDFMDLWNLLVERKTVVISFAIVIFLIIILNSYLNPLASIYKVSALVEPSTKTDMVSYNLESQRVFNSFKKALKSRALRMRYFNNNKLTEQFEVDHNFNNEYFFEERFNKKLIVQDYKGNIVISLLGADSKVAAQWVNGFIKMVNDYVVQEWIQEDLNFIEQEIENHKKMIENHKKIIEDLKLAIDYRQSIPNFEQTLSEIKLVLKLIETQAEANKILKQQFDSPSLVTIKAINNSIKNMNFNPLIIEKTIEDLELKAKGFKSNLEKLEAKRPDFSNISAMNFIHRATISAHPINKKNVKKFILTSVLSSLILGILAGFLVDFIARARKRRDSSSHIAM